MRSHQNVGVTFPIAFANPLLSVLSVWNDASIWIRRRREAARQERIVARLPAHLRQDIGELDCRPPAPRPLAETLRNTQQTFESTWIRYL